MGAVLRSIIFIGRAGCGACDRLYKEVIAPLTKKHPDRVTSHHGWDRVVSAIDKRKSIKTVPLIVVEKDGREEFRYSGYLSASKLEGIIEYDGEVLSLDDVLGDAR